LEGVLIHADTVRSATLRHEIPLSILDPFTYIEIDGRRVAVISVLEAGRVAAVAPDLEIIDPYELGADELIARGLRWDESEVELAARACERLGLTKVVVPADTGVAVADRLREAGIEVVSDQAEFIRRRRVKNELEIAGVRRAQAAATGAMTIAAGLLRDAYDRDGILHHRGDALTAEAVRDAMRVHAAECGAPMPIDVIVAAGAAGASGHEPGTGPLPSAVPIVIDIWPRDNESFCFCDMTRTFVVGDVPDDVREWHRLCEEALDRAISEIKDGADGRAIFDGSCEIFEAAGEPTLRTKTPGEPLANGFFHGLGHGVGLEVHEQPNLGMTAKLPLKAGDVVTVEPGLYRQGYGGVRLEDLILVTAEGAENLTNYSRKLLP
jgi:Xaa-Pro aminopeptidase